MSNFEYLFWFCPLHLPTINKKYLTFVMSKAMRCRGHWSNKKFANFFLSHFKLHNLLDISIFDSNATETSQVLRNFFRRSGYNFFALASPKDDKLYYQVLYKGFVFPLHLLQKLSTNTLGFLSYVLVLLYVHTVLFSGGW